jgi:hypothetical protein
MKISLFCCTDTSFYSLEIPLEDIGPQNQSQALDETTKACSYVKPYLYVVALQSVAFKISATNDCKILHWNINSNSVYFSF